jgi:hypothetical protein
MCYSIIGILAFEIFFQSNHILLTVGIPLFLIALARIVNLIVVLINKAANYRNRNKKFKKIVNRILITQKKDKLKIKIPTWVIIFILIGYIIFGAYLFTFEGWSYTNAVYFIFASISSIGFGDFVPGKRDRIWYIIGIVYIILGKLLKLKIYKSIKTFINRNDTIWNGDFISSREYKFRVIQL